MRKILVGALLTSAAACEAAPPPDCGGKCGPGTVCSAGQCVAVAPEAPPAPAEPTKKRRGRRKGIRGTPGAGEAPLDAADTGAGPDEALPPFVPVDDRKIPQFSSDHTQNLDLNAGSERPDESALDRQFARITPKIQDCVATASRYGEVGRGRLAVQLRLAGTGKVESVSVKAPASLHVWGIVPCARKAVYDHRFPTFDGPSVGVDFAVDID